MSEMSEIGPTNAAPSPPALPEDDSTAGPRRRRGERVAVLIVALLIGWFYCWTVRSNGDPWKFGSEQNDYYNLLLDGWLDGHLYMNVEVSPALLKLDDPYDPTRRPAGIALHDASFYHGKYYLYFGAAPIVVLMLPFRLVAGVDLPLPAAVLLFVYGGFLASAAALLALRRRYFPEVSGFTTVACVAVLGMAGLGPVLLRRPHMWELPIAAGYCFAMLTLWCVGQSIWAQRSRTGWFAAAAVAFGLAIASRPTYLLASPLLAAPLLHGWWSERRVPWRRGFAAAVPLAIIGAAMAWHNYARFGNALQFGQAYQLSLDYESKVTHFSPRYVPFNGWRYFFSAAQWSRYFPFIQPADLPPKPPGFAGHDDLYGVLRNLPFAWLALVAPLALWRRGREERAAFAAWLTSAAMLFCCMAGVLLFFFGSLARYQSDFTPALMLLACVGVLALERAILSWPTVVSNWVARPAWAVLAAYSIGFAALFSLQLDNLLRERNPPEARAVAALLNHVPAAVEQLLGVKHGAVAFTLRLPRRESGERVLLSVGDPPHVARIFTRFGDGGLVQFGFMQGVAPAVLSRPLTYDFGRAHDVRIVLGALLPPREHPLYAGWDPADVSHGTHAVTLAIDGETILDERRRFEANTGRLRVGREALADAASKFDGDIIALRREPIVRGETTPRSAGFARLRVKFPERAATPAREPLLAVGGGTDTGLVFVHYIDDAGRLTLGYVGGGGRAFESDVATVDVRRIHGLTVEWSAGASASRRALQFRLDGTILASRDVAWPSQSSAIVAGQNVAGEPGQAERFTGTLLQVQRSADGRDPLLGRGDTLRLRLQFPVGRTGTRDPLIVTGRYAAGDLLVVEYVDDKTVRFGLDHWGSGAVWSSSVPIDLRRSHDLEITLPALAAPADAALERPLRRGAAAVILDGGKVWEQTVDMYTAEAEEFWIGRNAIGGTSCGESFSGDVISAERSRPN